MANFSGQNMDNLALTFKEINGTSGAIPVDVITGGGGNAVATSVSMHDSGAETANFTTSEIDVSNYNAVQVFVNISAVTGTAPKMILEIESNNDGIAWNILRTIVDETTAGDVVTTTGDPDRGKLEVAGNYQVFIPFLTATGLRLKGTVEGTTPSFTFSAVAILN